MLAYCTPAKAEEDDIETVYCSDKATVYMGSQIFAVRLEQRNATVDDMRLSIVSNCSHVLTSHVRRICGLEIMDGLYYWQNVSFFDSVKYDGDRTVFYYGLHCRG